MRRPIDGSPRITSRHGQVTGMGLFGRHLGYDYAVPTGTPVKASVNGTIRMIASGGSGGNQIELDGGGYWHRFLHLQKAVVAVGQYVREGQIIGYSGNTGITTGPHLHHDVRRPSPWNQSFDNYIDWEAKLAAIVTPPVPGVPNVSGSVGKILYLKPHVDKWRVYPTTVCPKAGLEKAFLNPKKYGGLSYRILAVAPCPQTVEIQTTYFGRVRIYVDADAEIR